jgi:hypothetical protein
MKKLRLKTVLLLIIICGIAVSAFLFKSSAAATRPADDGSLKVQYASPAPKIAPLLLGPASVPVQAIVTRGGGKTYAPKFYSGRSERMAVKHGQAVPIRLSWPGDTAHQGVFVQAVDGGKIDGQSNHKSFALGPDKAVSFSFTPDSGPGRYEIVLRRGTTEEVLSFWVHTSNPTDPPAVSID